VPFDLPDHQHEAARLCQRHDPVGLREGRRHRLLHQYVASGLEGARGERGMMRRRRGDDHRVARRQEGIEGQGDAAGLRGHRRRALRILVANAGQTLPAQLEGVEASEMSGADDAYPRAHGKAS
jgi:hypothetical protein